MAVQVQSTDVFLCYQRLRVSCALCNNLQAARPRQTTERRLAPLYVEHMPSYLLFLILEAKVAIVALCSFNVVVKSALVLVLEDRGSDRDEGA